MNKVLLLALLASVAGGPTIAQDRRQHVPAAVRRSFQRDYPEARDPRWGSTNGHWHSDFDDHSRYDRGEMVANYDRYGHHIDSHIPYEFNDVPTIVVERTRRNYPGGRDFTYTRIERPAGKPLFQVNVNLQDRNRTLYLDEKGREQEYHHRH